MTDNVAITAGSGTTIAADDIGAGVLAQRVKPVWGPDGTGNDIDTASGKSLPVQLRSATGLIPIGEPTDAAATATDTTSVSGIALWKQISKSIQLVAGAITSSVMAVSIASGKIVSGAFASGSISDGAMVTLGTKADAKSVVTDTTAATLIALTKGLISILGEVQALPTANTVADRLKTLNSSLTAKGTAGSPAADVLSVQGVSTMTPLDVNPKVTATANGVTKSRVNAAASTNATSLKASAGQIYSIDVFNVAAYTVFLKLYNKASAPTVGTDTPTRTIPIPAGGGYSKSYQFGSPFATGIAYAITKLQADTDTTVVVAGDLTGDIHWI